MTPKQAEQFNLMWNTLKAIQKDYMTPEKIRKESQKMYGLDFEETIEMAYENIQGLAKEVTSKIRPIKIEKL